MTLVRGLMGKKPDHRGTVAGLGLKWRSHTVEVADTPEMRGMINKIGYMLTVTEAKAELFCGKRTHLALSGR